MDKPNTKMRMGFVLTISLAIFGYFVGGSAITGQYDFQTYTTHGLLGPFLEVLYYVVCAIMCIFIGLDCRKRGIKTVQEGFEHYMGKIIGRIVYIYSIVYMAIIVLMCISSAGSTLNEHFNIPYYVGAIIMTALCIGSVVFGMKTILSVCGKLSYAVVAMLIILVIVSLANATNTIAEGDEMARSASDLLQIASNPFVSLILALFAMIPFILPFFINIAIEDEKTSKKDIIGYSLIGNLTCGIVFALVCVAQLANFSLCTDAQIVNLALINEFAPVLGSIFVIIIMIAILTTIAPSIVMVVDGIVKKEKKPNVYKLVGIIIAVVCFFIGTFASYGQIVNALISIGGYVGIGVIVVAVIRGIVRAVSNKNKTEADEN